MGVKLKYISNFDIEELIRLDGEGVLVKDIAKKFKIPLRIFHFYISKFNINLKNKGCRFPKNHDYFDVIDNEKKAYLLGFFIADGNISLKENRISVNNSIDDKEIINLFQSEIYPIQNATFYETNNGVKKRKKQIRFRVCSKKIVNTLIKTYGIKPNKTYDNNFKFDFTKIPNELIHHFIRGYFDGDGNYSNQGLSFCFNSFLFAEQVSNWFKNKINNPVNKIFEFKGKTTKYYVLTIAVGEERKKIFFDIFYKDAKIFLNRKRDKVVFHLNKKTRKNFEKICGVENCNNKHQSKGYCNKHYLILYNNKEYIKNIEPKFIFK